ncbi:MAG: hypothetical protein ACPHK0_08600 [Dehalococcoidia bacterium]
MTITDFTTGKEPIEPTLGERIDEFHSVQQLLRFDRGTSIHARAQQDLEWMRPALTVHMVAEGVTHARTKIATATIDDYGHVTVERYEVAL